jgi:hypothetical protein
MISKLTIWVDDSDIEDADPNLEYDGFNILKWDIDLDIEEIN